MSTEIFYCWNCRNDIRHVSDINCFFWCNSVCKQEHEDKQAKAKEKWDKDAEKAEREEVKENTALKKKKDAKATSKNLVKKASFVTAVKEQYKCGKCGNLGHNARTCGK